MLGEIPAELIDVTVSRSRRSASVRGGPWRVIVRRDGSFDLDVEEGSYDVTLRSAGKKDSIRVEGVNVKPREDVDVTIPRDAIREMVRRIWGPR